MKVKDGLPAVPEFIVPIRPYFFDTDAGGVVHNIAYLRMIEVARSDFAEYLGWKLKDMTIEKEECPVVVRTEIDYLKPARLGDSLKIKAQLIKLEKIRFYFSFEMIRENHSDGTEEKKEEKLVQARQTMVTVNLKTGRPRPIRKEWLEQWPHLVEP